MVRFKSRWLLVEFLSYEDPTATQTDYHHRLETSDIKTALNDSVVRNFGDEGWGAVADSLFVKYFSPTTSLCIIRVGRDVHRTALGAVTLMTTIKGRPYIPHTVHVSGTLKKAQLAAIKHNRILVARLKARSRGADRNIEWEEYLTKSDKAINAIDTIS